MNAKRIAAALAVALLLWGPPVEAQERDSTRDTTNAELRALRAAADTTARDTAAARRQAARSQNALNPEITVTGDFRITRSNPDNGEPTFIAREFEIGFQSALDPFATAKVFAAFEDGEAVIEEGYIFLPALPGGVRLDFGIFRQDVGELNRWHLHALPEDEYPLVVRRFAGEEGLAGTGLSVYYPLPFSGRAGTYELTLQLTNASNEVLYLGGTHQAANAKLAGFWQLSRSTYLMASASGVYGNNPDSSLRTTLMVGAARFTWRPPAQARSRELTLRGEVWSLRRRIGGSGPTRLGWYADASWKLNRSFVVSTRYDRVASPDPLVAGNEWAVTPALTYWQSEFVYLRGLLEHARGFGGATSNRLAIQIVYAMGPHKHELF